MSKAISQIFINGCGPVGLTLAKCLACSPYIESIVLLDRKVPSPARQLPPVPNQRVYSLNGPTLTLYEKLGISKGIRKRGEMSQIQVVSKQADNYINWTQNKAELIENDELVYSLMSNLKQNHSAKLKFIESEVEAINIFEQHCEVNLKNSQQLKSRLIVGSDGNKSKIKQLAGINTYGWPYRQRGIVCTMKINQNIPNFTGYQIYHDRNVLALLPLWDNYVSLVWSVGIPDFEYLMKLNDQEFQSRLNNVIRNSNISMKNQNKYITIPLIEQIVNKRLSFPLNSLQSEFYTKERLALVGDAAHTIHPMAGLGVNSGIMDSIYLANNIIRNMKTGNDVGDLISLSQYEAEAKAFNYKNSLGMEGIKKIFETDISGLNLVKRLGLEAFQNSGGLKQMAKNLVEEQHIDYEWESL